jgi:hypothetical protein
MRTQNIFEKAAFAAALILAVSGTALVATQPPTGRGGQKDKQLLSTIAFVSTRDNEHRRRHFPDPVAGRQEDGL